ncbi:uncharacterized protein [Coffea arabica]|uniref:peptidyl-tRNA hydrolase n=1 Tax=Coffea arabica TaxID=13443 RepID=A0A6P6U124_COFAR|nr:putative peptidyl-tRNA hydrolase PTRHD1 isoform X1 [Coffea arabica]
MASILTPRCFSHRLSPSFPRFHLPPSSHPSRRCPSLIRMEASSNGASDAKETAAPADPSSDSTNAAASNSESEDPLIQYVVLRRDLIDTWPLGSVVTQGCHASVAAIWSFKDDPHTLNYCNPSNLHAMRKVTLEVKGEAQIVNLSEKLNSSGIDHKLWIEQPENIPTCFATKPYPKSIVSSFFKKVKLCK